MLKEIYSSDPQESTKEELMADSINDAIKVGLVRSSKLEHSSTEDSSHIVQVTVRRSEIDWYMKNLYSAAELRSINKDKVVQLTLDLLLTPRVVRLMRQPAYAIVSEAVEVKGVLNGVHLTAKPEKVKVVKQSEPQAEYHAG